LPHAESHDPAPASSEPTALPHPGRPHLVWGPCRPRLAEPHHGVHQLPAHACGEAIWERRMRETRPSGVMRGEPVVGHGMRAMSHVRGNPDTEVDRSLTPTTCSPTLLGNILLANFLRLQWPCQMYSLSLPDHFH